MSLTDDELATCLELLERSRELEPNDPRFLALENAAAHLRKHAKKRRKAARRRATAAHDRALREQTGQAGAGEAPAPAPAQTLRERACYVCKQPYRELHGYYRSLCPRCGDASQAMRELPVSLAGRRVLITGGRVKIGYATALRCLRAGAEVAVTTRFPADAAQRYAAEPDAASWGERLTIHGLDFRRLDDVMRAIEAWRDPASGHLDLLINNAAQTVWHGPEHYAALYAAEARAAATALPGPRPPDTPGFAVERWGAPDSGSRPALGRSLEGVDLAIDLRREHSWVMRLAEVPPVEMVETQVVNAIVPALLCSRLEPALLRSPFPDRYVVNVTAVEGQFRRTTKLVRHPHTNMAKAGLNMITRTSAHDYAERGIYMVSVDPGWVSHEGPAAARAKAEAEGFHPPLDMDDAAARILDPVARGLAGRPIWGVLLKDYAEVPW
ncbi:probable short chain dehydrogenase [Plesiocystis pacifica SIR-1]|uniref:Probable short chain dehydrogenase n=1 Tax=Plesiocystis pacifica SIR-1 TaxID=391625 RepID=A6GD37_9BACT|nr:SDR family oxidoreductase [Plesiocystis pacifica]EDM76195.1 probable short chain dehydrogenase [Plesiocystis pacifica SIR-1]